MLKYILNNVSKRGTFWFLFFILLGGTIMDWYEDDIEVIEDAVRNASPRYDEDFEYLYKILKKRYKKVNERLTQMESKMDRIEELLVSMQTNTQIPTETDSIETTETTSSQPITCTIRLSDDS